MYMSGKEKSEVSSELEAFLKDESAEMVEWLWTRAKEVSETKEDRKKRDIGDELSTFQNKNFKIVSVADKVLDIT
tara:strand:+ start:320 stop:544 length:225 start_codon:yes stop_codon:yes gene_type:complete